MVSIKKAADELDRLEELLRGVAMVYGHAIRSTAQYAIEIDPLEAQAFRAHLEGLQAEARSAITLEDWRSVQASLRGELRDYCERGTARLVQLRGDIKSAASAMQAFAESVATNGASHESELKGALRDLQLTARKESLIEIRTEITSVCGAITATVEKMEREHCLVVAQLGEEIRLLHKQIEIEREVPFLDPETGLWNRKKLDLRIAELCERDSPFCILLVSIRNLKRLDSLFSKVVLDAAVQALLHRLTNLLGEDVKIARWSEDSFAAILALEPSAAMHISREAGSKLSGRYPVQQDGLSRSVPLHAVTGVIDRSAGVPGPSFHQKLLQMSEALSGA